MVAHFLKHELVSERFGPKILSSLKRAGREKCILENPNLEDDAENTYRIRLLGDLRGYRQNRGLFKEFPGDVSWARAALSKSDLSKIRYVDYSYWTELSNGMRSPAEAVKTIRSGITVFGQSNEPFMKAARAVERGIVFPEIIVVGKDEATGFVVLEGHLRLTAYLLAEKNSSEEVRAFVGFSNNLTRWMAEGDG